MIALQQSMFGSLLQQRRAVPFTPFTKVTLLGSLSPRGA